MGVISSTSSQITRTAFVVVGLFFMTTTMLLMTLFNDLQVGFVVAAADPTILQLPPKTQWRIYLMQTSDQVHHLNSNEYAVGFIREDYFGREAQSLQSKELMQFHVTYKAKNAVFYSLVPNVFSWSERSNSSVVEPRIEFGSSEASVQLVQEAINGTVWKSVSLVYTATGEQVNRFLCWYPTYTRSKPQYSLFHLLKAATSSELVKLVTNSSSCFCVRARYNLWVTMSSNDLTKTSLSSNVRSATRVCSSSSKRRLII